MKIIEIEKKPYHEIYFNSSGPQGRIRKCVLPFYRVWVENMPNGISSLVVTSDLQGREMGDKNRLIGEQVAEELYILQELNEIPHINLVILAGDLYDYPDCRKMGGTGNVTSVWNAFAKNFDGVVGVHGNHDTVNNESLLSNISILDGNTTSYNRLKISGVSGIIGRLDRNQRKNEAQFEKALMNVISGINNVVVLHQGPDDPKGKQFGEPLIRKCFEKRGSNLVFFGHCHWSIPLIKIGSNQVLNVDSKLYQLIEKNRT